MKYPAALYVEETLRGLRRPVEYALAAALLLFGIHQCRARDRAIRDAALNAYKLHAADSALQVALDQVIAAHARTDTVREAVTKFVYRYAVDTLWRRDTVLVDGEPRLAVPLPTIARTDSTIAACNLLAMRCAEERVAETRRAEAAEQKIALLEAAPDRSCRGAFLWGAGLGFLGGGYVGVRLSR